MSDQELNVRIDEQSGQVASVRLYNQELLDIARPCVSELFVNGQPLGLRPHADPNMGPGKAVNLKGERFVNQLSGWSLVLARSMGPRSYAKFPCFGIQTLIRRELCDLTYNTPGPGGPAVEAPLHVDTFSLLNWNWQLWGDDTRMIFPSAHSTGPTEQWGHSGYEHDSPEVCKGFLENIWRRIYPGCLVIHGGLFYNIKTEHWLAITCRRPNVGYSLNITDAGRAVSYDFTLHAPFALGDSLVMPEIKLYHGRSRQTMMEWLGDYATHYYQEPPEWVHRTVWGEGLAWNNRPSWTEQADHWEKRLDTGEMSGIGYSLVTNRPVNSGTTPTGYEPDPNHGTTEEFKTMCHRIADRGVPLLIWMSHSGLSPQGSDVDDDWFIRGIDGRVCRSWGNVDGGMAHCNPGHPGYIEYTKKWIRFYIRECRCKGIFFDCLGWAFPPDFRPRSFMRYPGDTNRMAVRFVDEMYACIKECDPEAILLGEGWSSDLSANIFSVHSNPVRAIDGMGPRDFLLSLNQYGPKRLVIDQGPRLFPASGMCTMDQRPGSEKRNRYLTKLLKEQGGSRTWTAIPGDLSIFDDLLIVPAYESDKGAREILLPDRWNGMRSLKDEIEGAIIERSKDGRFVDVPPGIYRMIS